MLRQRTVGRGEEDGSEGIFIGDVEEPNRSLKDKIGVKNENNCWKYLSLVLIILTVFSVTSNVYQHKQLSTYQHNIEELQNTYQNYQAESTADRHSVEECRAEMTKMETHMNNRENEKTELEKEISRLRRAIENGGVTENPGEEHDNDQDGDTPPTPHPVQGDPTRSSFQDINEQKRKEEEERRQMEEQQKQKEEVERQQEVQRQQNELLRQQEAQRQQEEQQRQKRQEEEQRQKQEEQQRQLKEHQNQQDELQQQENQEG